MKRILTLFILFVLIFPNLVAGQPMDSTSEIIITIDQEYHPTSPPGVTAQGAVVIDQRTGKVLYGKNEHQKMFPASTTKVLTALIAIEMDSLDDLVTVGIEVNMVPSDSSIAGLVPREEITLEHLIYGLMINSGNDAGNTIAVHIARSVSEEDLSINEALNYFAELMNDRAREAGALNSNFKNPHGYHDPEHYTTAYDLAHITREAMENDLYRLITARRIFDQTTYWNKDQTRIWSSKNRLINEYDANYYEYATGGKTGWTTPAGPCLVSSASRDGLDLIAVVLKSGQNGQWNDSKSLLEYGFNNYEYHQLFTQGSVFETLPLENYSQDDWGSMVTEIVSEDFGDIFHKSDLSKIERTIKWNEALLSKNSEPYDTIPRLLAPIYKGQIVGEVIFTLRDEVIATSPIAAVRDAKKKSFIYSVTQVNEGFNYKRLFIILIAVFVTIKVVVFIINVRRRRRRRFIYRR